MTHSTLLETPHTFPSRLGRLRLGRHRGLSVGQSGTERRESTIEQSQMFPHQWRSRVAKSCHQDNQNTDGLVQPCPLLSAAAFPPSNHASHGLFHPFLTSSAGHWQSCNRANISPDAADRCRWLFLLLSSTWGYFVGKR